MYVLVTGVTGFIGRHVAAAALRAGHRVRGSLRDIGRADEVRATLPEGEVDVVTLDLMSDTGWDAALDGIEGLLHTASPVPTRTPDTDDEVLRPAIEGTMRAMEAAARAGTERVVVTSSIAAVLGNPAKGPYDTYGAEDWTDPDLPGLRAYARSKTLAERTARELAERHGLHLATVNPGFVFGAPLGDKATSSLTLIRRLVSGKDPMLPRLSFPSVDVEDVAEAHIAALKAENGARIIASGETLWMSEIADIVREVVPSSRPARTVAPNWVVRLLSVVSPDLRLVSQGLGDCRKTDPSTCEALLGRPLRDPREAIAEAARALA
ncbi:MAG: NAD-dependent epimerase/dehydratase family protein [Pseudomonadota bacterium]